MPIEPDTTSLRDSLEAAITQVENTDSGDAQPVQAADAPAKPVQDAPTAPVQEPTAPAAPVQEPVSAKAAKAAKPAGMEPAPKPTALDTDNAPKSWKPGPAAKWAALDPEVRSEIARREREVGKAFGENSQVREFHKQFSEVIRPFEARIAAQGRPLDAIANLLAAENFLYTAPPVPRAKFMAKLINDYGIDIKELDAALAGEAPTDPVQHQLNQLLEQRLAPLQTFLAQQQQVAQAQEQRVQEEAAASIEAMASDPAKFPHFDEVREDMADIIEMNARRKVYLTPEQAYSRAIAMNPETAAAYQRLQQDQSQRQQAQAQDARAQRALSASSSLRSQPITAPVANSSDDSLRGTLEAAFSQYGGR